MNYNTKVENDPTTSQCFSTSQQTLTYMYVQTHHIPMHNGQIQARREALHVILGSALVFLGVIGSFKLIGLYRTETVCFRAGLTIFTTLICSFCVCIKSSCFIFLV